MNYKGEISLQKEENIISKMCPTKYQIIPLLNPGHLAYFLVPISFSMFCFFFWAI